MSNIPGSPRRDRVASHTARVKRTTSALYVKRAYSLVDASLPSELGCSPAMPKGKRYSGKTQRW